MGVAKDRIQVIPGDTEVTPHGGGTWASRGAGIGGETALQAATLRKNVLEVAAAILQASPAELDIRRHGGDAATRRATSARTRPHRLFPIGHPAPGDAARIHGDTHFTPRDYPFAFTNGIQACWLEVDVDTGFVKVLRHLMVEDCGRIINPMLVD